MMTNLKKRELLRDVKFKLVVDAGCTFGLFVFTTDGHSSVLLTYRVGAHFALLSLTAWRYLLFVYTQSATGRFRLPLRRSGTVCRTTSYLLHPFRHQPKTFWFSVSFSDLIPQLFSLVCNFDTLCWI